MSRRQIAQKVVSYFEFEKIENVREFPLEMILYCMMRLILKSLWLILKSLCKNWKEKELSVISVKTSNSLKKQKNHLTLVRINNKNKL